MAEVVNQDEATRGIWATGQMCDAVGDPEAAMTAPGSVPAQDVSPFRRDPDPAQVTAERYDGRRLEHDGHDHGGAEAWPWDDAGERRD
jgi:hypothetical protein